MHIIALVSRVCLLIFILMSVHVPEVFSKEGDVTHIPADIEAIFPTATRIGTRDPDVPVIPVFQLNQLLGYVFESNDFVDFMGFAGEPINILIGLDPQGVMKGLKILQHNEPIFVYGLGQAPFIEFVNKYKEHSIRERFIIDSADQSSANSTYFDGVTKATVSVLVANDTIISSALKVARAKLDGFIAPSNMMLKPSVGPVETLSFAQLLERGLITHWQMPLNEVLADQTLESEVLSAISDIEPETGQFVDLYLAFINIPVIGKNLLGEQEFARLQENLKPGEHALLVFSNGDYSYVSEEFVPQTVPTRLSLTQSGFPTDIRDIDFYSYYEPNFAITLPEYQDVHVLRLKSQSGFELSRVMTLGIGVNYKASFFDIQQHLFTREMTLPDSLFMLNPDAINSEPKPLWMRIWEDRAGIIAITCLYLIGISVLFVKQTALVKHEKLTHWIRGGSMLFVLFFIGFYAQGQLSVVNIYTLLLALYNGFKIEVFLLDPVIFILWVFVFVSLFIVGRGLYCGWLCPFGALQEFAGLLAKKLRIKQIKIKPEHHKWGQTLKYFILVGLLVSAFFSLNIAEKLAEVEPFKTSITLHFVRTWPFVVYAVLLLLLSMKIHKVYCRYLCPLGAGLAIVGRFPLFKLLRRREECGSPCQLCKTKKCDIDAINKDGSIDYGECIQCLECVVTIENPNLCVIDKYKDKKVKASKPASSIQASDVIVVQPL
ncbi:MAG: 4Fe-4S binding protein [Glaciecola sp.]|nr:4Fe-4S binding protein [Glaciecola sp.]